MAWWKKAVVAGYDGIPDDQIEPIKIPGMTNVTRILSQIESGDPSAAEQLLPLVYDELRKLALARLVHEPQGPSLQATVLVHDAYLRLVDVNEQPKWNSSGHFFGAAAEAMRRILVEHARRKRSEKHGGGFERVDLDIANPEIPTRTEELIAFDEAFSRLEQQWPEKAQLVKLRYFAGFTLPEAASALGISQATAERYWSFCKSWLYSELK